MRDRAAGSASSTRDGLALLVPDAGAARPRSPTSIPRRRARPTRRASTPVVLPALPGRDARATATTRRRVAALVDKGAADAAVLLRPVSVADDRAPRPRPRAHAAEDDVLRAQAAHRMVFRSARLKPATLVGLVDRPGRRRCRGAAREVAGALTLGRGDELALHLDLVRRPRRRRGTRRPASASSAMIGQARQRERERRVGAGLVVHEERVLADVGDVARSRLAELVQHDAVLVVGAEADRLAVLAAR